MMACAFSEFLPDVEFLFVVLVRLAVVKENKLSLARHAFAGWNFQGYLWLHPEILPCKPSRKPDQHNSTRAHRAEDPYKTVLTLEAHNGISSSGNLTRFESQAPHFVVEKLLRGDICWLILRHATIKVAFPWQNSIKYLWITSYYDLQQKSSAGTQVPLQAHRSRRAEKWLVGDFVHHRPEHSSHWLSCRETLNYFESQFVAVIAVMYTAASVRAKFGEISLIPQYFSTSCRHFAATKKLCAMVNPCDAMSDQSVVRKVRNT